MVQFDDIGIHYGPSSVLDQTLSGANNNIISDSDKCVYERDIERVNRAMWCGSLKETGLSGFMLKKMFLCLVFNVTIIWINYEIISLSNL